MAISRRTWVVGGILAALTLPIAWSIGTFPSDKTPEGAYLRIVKAVNQGQPQSFFAYIDEEAQHACYSILSYRQQSLARVRGGYPQEARGDLELRLEQIARLEDAPYVFAAYAEREGWLSQLRADLSGIHHVETEGARATVVTANGTRYAFRRRPGGIYGLSAFTAYLMEEAEKAARDHKLIEKTASDYQKLNARSTLP